MTATFSAPAQQDNRVVLTKADRKIFGGDVAEVHSWMTDQEVLSSIGCNFNVESCIPSVDGREYPEARLWLRSDNRDHLGTFGNRRQVIQPGDFVKYFRHFCDNSQNHISLDVVGTPDSGKTFYMASKLVDSKLEDLMDKPGDPYRGFQIKKDLERMERTDVWLIVTDYYGMSAAPKAKLYFNELICYNGMVQSSESKLVGLTHLRQQGVKEVGAVLEDAIDHASTYFQFKDRLIRRKITREFASNFIRNFYRDPSAESRKVQKLEALYSGGLKGGELETRRDNAWRLLSAVTEAVTHGHIADSAASRGRAFKSMLDGSRKGEITRFAEALDLATASV